MVWYDRGCDCQNLVWTAPKASEALELTASSGGQPSDVAMPERFVISQEDRKLNA